MTAASLSFAFHGLTMSTVRRKLRSVLEAEGVIDPRDKRTIDPHSLRTEPATAALLAPRPTRCPPLHTLRVRDTGPSSDDDDEGAAELQKLADRMGQLTVTTPDRTHAPCLRQQTLPAQALPRGVLEQDFLLVEWPRLPFAKTTVPVYPGHIRHTYATEAQQYARELALAQWHVPARVSTSAVLAVLRPDERMPAWFTSHHLISELMGERLLAACVLKRSRALNDRINHAHAHQVRLLEAWFRTALSDLLAQPDPRLPTTALAADQPRLVLFQAAAPGARAPVFHLPPEVQARAMAPFARLFAAYTQRQLHLLEAQVLMLSGLLVEGRAALLASSSQARIRAADIGELVGWPDVQASLDENPAAYWASVPGRYRTLMTPLRPPNPAPDADLAPYRVAPTGPVAERAGRRLAREQVAFLHAHADLTAQSLPEPHLAAIAEDPGWPDGLQSVDGEDPLPSPASLLAAVVQLCTLEHASAHQPGNKAETRAASALATQMRRHGAATTAEAAKKEEEEEGTAMEV